MTNVTSGRLKPPSGFTRFFLRVPILLYRLGLGWLLGERFLLLTHTGRTSGLPRSNVLGVVRADRESGAYLVLSGWGEKSDWVLNVTKTPQVSVQVGRRKFPARAERLSPEEAEQEVLDYARRHPKAAKTLAQIFGFDVSKGDAGYRAFGRTLPMFAFHPPAS